MKKMQLVSTVHFYDSIADEYDMQLSGESDTAVRQEVAEYFRRNVEQGPVMDFGGGTGLDLPWLIQDGYTVYFCEPAEKMKAKAKTYAEKLKRSNSLFFLSAEKSDFRLWNTDNRPADVKLKGILANFGVLNYVQDLPKLFEVFASISEEGSSAVVNVLYANPKKLLSRYFKSTVKALVKGGKVKTGSQHNGLLHETTLYSVRDLKCAADKYFSLKMCRPLGENSDFLMLHFLKK